MVVIEDFEMPESCLRCTKRKCLHIDGKAYQMCGLNEDGYLTESWFNSENIPKSCRSEHCPLREVEAIPKAQYDELKANITMMRLDYEARLKADMAAMLTELQLDIEECVDGGEGSPQFEEGVAIARTQVVEMIQQKINALKGEE